MSRHIQRIGSTDFDTNPYYNDKKYCNNGYYKGREKVYQCVDGAIARMQEDSDMKLVYYTSRGETEESCDKIFLKRSGYGNAINLWNDTNFSKTIKGSEAREGDCIVYGKNWGNGCGHVRIIEKIEGNVATCFGANEDGNGLLRFDIKVNLINGTGDRLFGLIGYIHNDALTDDNDYKKLYNDLKTEYDLYKSLVNGTLKDIQKDLHKVIS